MPALQCPEVGEKLLPFDIVSAELRPSGRNVSDRSIASLNVNTFNLFRLNEQNAYDLGAIWRYPFELTALSRLRSDINAEL